MRTDKEVANEILELLKKPLHGNPDRKFIEGQLYQCEWFLNKQEPLSSDAVLADVRAELLKELLNMFIDLLDEAKHYYHLYPNSHRGTVEEYFEIEDKLIKKVSEHFS